MNATEPLSDEFEAIAYRLAAMASGPPNPTLVAAELEEIRAELRRLADRNAELRAELLAAATLTSN
jgi:hypothetical protein